MSLRPQAAFSSVPEDTARVARAAFRRGNPYLLLRDRLGAVFDDVGFADLYPKLGQPAYAPWRLALVTLMQFREGLSDRQAADAVRGRIDWKYLLALDLADPGFDSSVLCEFRGRLLEHEAGGRLLERLLDAAREGGLLKTRGRQRTDGTYVLAAIRALNRLELVGETLRAALNAIAAVAPEWLRTIAPPDWHERYDRRVESPRLPEAGPKRDAYAVQVGADGYALLDALDRPDVPADLPALPAVAVLRRVWARHYERVAPDAGGPKGGGVTAVRQRALRARGPDDRIDERPSAFIPTTRTPVSAPAPAERVGRLHRPPHRDMRRGRAAADRAHRYDRRRRARSHAGRGDPRGTGRQEPGPVRASGRRGLHERRFAGLRARTARHRPNRTAAPEPDLTWQSRSEGAFDAADFAVNWDRQVVRCPEGKESASWKTYGSPGRARGRPLVHARFRPADCRACPSRARCTRSASEGRTVSLFPRHEHEVLVAARARERTDESRELYAQRQGVESTMSQGVRAFGLRQARYRGLAKTALQHVTTAAAIDLDRLAAWFAERPLAPTRVSRFANLAA